MNAIIKYIVFFKPNDSSTKFNLSTALILSNPRLRNFEFSFLKLTHDYNQKFYTYSKLIY